MSTYVNLEADIYFPEDQGIVQVTLHYHTCLLSMQQIENFGIHIHCDGTVIYGMKIEAVMDRIVDGISLDHLSRLIVDVHQVLLQLLCASLSRCVPRTPRECSTHSSPLIS